MQEGPGQEVPEGWHEDPWDTTRLRWWDGSEWTGHTHEKQSAAPQPAAAPVAPTSQGVEAYIPPGGAPVAGSERNLLPWIAGGVAAVLVVVLAIVLLGGGDDGDGGRSGGGGSARGAGNAAIDDAEAQTAARTAQTAAETLATDNGGSYEELTPSAMAKFDPSLKGVPLTVEPSSDSYVITVSSGTGNSFTISHGIDGTTAFRCSTPGEGSCPATGDWSTPAP
jgi:hypothetical protein